jgi:hypothetical protein
VSPASVSPARSDAAAQLPVLPAVRILGLAVPPAAMLLGPPATWMLAVALAAALLGELIDRAEFYDEVEVRTPAREIAAELRRALDR